MKKSYVVSVKSPSDWPEIHKILTQDGTLEDNIPSHACVCVDEKPNCGNRATYLLDDEEAELIRNHEKVKYVGLDQKVYFSEYPELFPKPSPTENRFSGNVKNYRYLFSDNPSPTSPTSDELNRTGWQLGRIESKTDLWEDNSQYNFDSGANAFIASPVSRNPTYRTGEDGSGIDCVVTDDAVWFGHPEFVDNGVTQVRDIILDGPYFLDKEYFDGNNLTTTFLGRTTSQESAAREWWRDNTKRSGRFINVGTINVNENYTRANVCGDFSSKPNYDADHGTPVASIMYGKTHGWAFNSNKWSIAGFASDNSANLIDIISGLDAIRIWHIQKPSTSGVKNPTVVNSSWGFIDYVANQFTFNRWWYYNFRGSKSYFANKNRAPRFLKNFTSGNNSRYSKWLNPNSSWEGQTVDAGEDLVNLDGLIWVVAAGNDNQKQVTPLDADYNNWWSSKANPEEYEKRFVNRRGFPAQCGYVSSTNTYKVFSIGALDSWRFSSNGLLGKERKTSYSNAGSAIDILSPAESTMGASGDSATDQYKRYDSASYYSWLNTEAYDYYFNGTSAASPAFAGFLASIFSNRKNWNWSKFKKYLQYIVTNISSSSLYNGPGNIDRPNSFDWTDAHNLHGQYSKIIYNEQISQLSFTSDLSNEDVFEGDKLTLEVVPTSPFNGSIDSFTYRWEKKESGADSFQVVPGEIFSKIIVLDVSLDEDGAQYRCFVDSDGPYDPKYSATSTISVSPTSITILSQPTSVTDAVVGEEVSFSFTVDDIGNLSYQWERKLSGSDNWFSLVGQTTTTLSFKTNSGDEKASYRCLISWNNGAVSTYTNEVLLDLGDQISITTEPLDVNIYSSQSIVMRVDALLLSKREGILSYQWEYSKDRLKWLPVSGQTFSIYVKDDAETTDAGFYRCKLTESLSLNSPLYSRVVTALVNKPPITIITQPIPSQIIEGNPIFFSTDASLPEGINLPISYQWQYSQNNSDWEDLDGFVNKSIYLSTSSISDAGFYRCKISSPRALRPVIYTSEAFLSVSTQNISIRLDRVVSKTITLGQSVKFDVIANFVGESPFYRWESRKLSISPSWNVVQNSRKLNYLEFVPNIFDHETQYRCVVYNNAGYSVVSDIATLTISRTYQIINNTSKLEVFSRTDHRSIYLYIDVVSTYESPITYQWQKHEEETGWVDIPLENNNYLNLDVSSLLQLSRYRCRVNITDNIILYGNECLVQELTNFNFFNGEEDDLDVNNQRSSLEERVADPFIVKNKCSMDNINTCQSTLEEILTNYKFYDYQRGLFKSFGDIDFPWRLSDLTPGIIFHESNDKWSVASYRSLIAYKMGSRVLLIEEAGYQISLYEALEDIIAISGAFDKKKWKKICSIKTSVPAGIPDIGELLSRYRYYNPDPFFKNWGNINSRWSEQVYSSAVKSYESSGFSIEQFEAYLKEHSSDRWSGARVRRDNFYIKGDIVLVDSPCADTLLVYLAIKDMPVNDYTIEAYFNKKFEEKIFLSKEDEINNKLTTIWELAYSVPTGKNKCLGYSRKKTPEEGYDVIELGSNGHYVEYPIPYRIKSKEEIEELNVKFQNKRDPKIITDREIFDLDHKDYPYTTTDFNK